jgi:hypothetical protein
MTDGDPNYNRDRGSWTIKSYQPTADYYLSLNDKRSPKLIINSISIGQDSPWLKDMSGRGGGTYKMINQAYTLVQ